MRPYEGPRVKRPAKRTSLPMFGGPRDGQTHPAERKNGKGTKPVDKIVLKDGHYERVGDSFRWRAPHRATNPATDIVNGARLPRHPSPTVLADHLERVAKRIRSETAQAERQAAVLASRGLPATVGGGGSRSADPTTSVERAAGLNGDDGHATLQDPDLISIDYRLAKAQRDAWRSVLEVDQLLTTVSDHWGDEDPLPAGTGFCARCNRLCRPNERHPEDRIKSGYGALCCYMTWYRAGRPDRVWFNSATDEDMVRLRAVQAVTGWMAA